MKLISLLKLVELVMICTWSPSNPESVRNLKQSKKRRQSLKLPVLSYCSVDCIFFCHVLVTLAVVVWLESLVF